jgi:hypothetical protein
MIPYFPSRPCMHKLKAGIAYYIADNLYHFTNLNALALMLTHINAQDLDE